MADRRYAQINHSHAGGGSGNVSNTGTPANDQVAVWTDATTLEGTAGLTYSTTALTAGNYVFNTDQTVGAGQDNYVLTYDNASGEILLEATPAEVNDLSTAVTWANVPDANITQTSVTQHQAALSITESQISDLTHTTEVNDLSAAVTWANVPDANITEGSVTQHEAALAITQSQITAPRYCILSKAADPSAANYTSQFTVNFWDTVTDTVGGMTDIGGSNPERITIPAGVNYVRLTFKWAFLASVTSDVWISLNIYKNASRDYLGVGQQAQTTGLSNPLGTAITGILPVVTNDYFEARIQVQTDTSTQCDASRTWFQCEILG